MGNVWKTMNGWIYLENQYAKVPVKVLIFSKVKKKTFFLSFFLNLPKILSLWVSQWAKQSYYGDKLKNTKNKQ